MPANIDQLFSYVDELGRQSQLLGRKFSRPKLVEVDGERAFRHDERDDLLMSYLKCLRGLSSLNAALALLKSGFVQEVGVLCRCVDEFCQDVLFLAEPLGDDGEYNADQKQHLQEYSQEEFVDGSSLPKNAPRKRVSRDKIRAGIARMKEHPINPSDGNQFQRILDKTISGYVHGAYVHTMEMYGGSTLEGCDFHLTGMCGTPRVSEWTQYLSNYVYRLATALEVVARRCNDHETVSRLVESRQAFENATGFGLGDPQKLLRTAKNS